jgi:hypothetical protein
MDRVAVVYAAAERFTCRTRDPYVATAVEPACGLRIASTPGRLSENGDFITTRYAILLDASLRG